ncbi:hypothetical protein HON36_04735 [Candidatus Parcubacteria bacterium]|jgi:hypothetical protein|nr:hypothetical protein [Candidatus Parcubacteria bacterium]MBT7228959.1 hypothetical protein [Candidatus Parcubacteria bacterium]
MQNIDLEISYNVGDIVPTDGEYACVPCGYKKTYRAGETFLECISCLDKFKDVDTEAITDEGTWEKVN